MAFKMPKCSQADIEVPDVLAHSFSIASTLGNEDVLLETLRNSLGIGSAQETFEFTVS